MKILLIGEYSNVHATLARAFRALGHEVLVVSNGDFWKNYPRDIDVSRKLGKAGGLMLMARIARILPRLKGFDIVQLINPMFFELKAERLFSLYHFLRKHNRKVVLGAFGMDYYWAKTCITEMPLRYSDFNIGRQLRKDNDALLYRNNWISTVKERLNKEIANDCDGIVTGLYEYDVCYRPVFPNKTRFIPLPIDCDDVQVDKTVQDPEQPLRVFIGISKNRSAYKGTDIMLSAAKEVKARRPELLDLRVAEGLPFDVYKRTLEGSDAIMDQLYSYTPAMNALLAMSKGIVVIGGGEPENYEIIGEKELRPIINVEPNKESVIKALENLIDNRKSLPKLKADSIEYVRRHHDYMKVARQYLDFYKEILCR